MLSFLQINPIGCSKSSNFLLVCKYELIYLYWFVFMTISSRNRCVTPFFILIRVFFLTTLTEEVVINDILEIIQIIQAICIGLVVATFLYMTGRSRKAIALRSESLVLLNDKALDKEEQFGKLLCEAIYKVILPAYLLISISTFE